MYEHRFYRKWMDRKDLQRFAVQVAQSDLLILCDLPLKQQALGTLVQVRKHIEAYIARHAVFATTLAPLAVDADAPAVVQTMAAAADRFQVGPMAAVAGAVAEAVGTSLLQAGAETVFVENGGDAFVRSLEPVRFALYAGEASPFADCIGFEVQAVDGLGVCTSSGRVGPSLSFGKADAVVAICPDAAAADAAATAIANEIQGPDDVDQAVARAERYGGLTAVLACAGDRLGMWGDIRIVRI